MNETQTINPTPTDELLLGLFTTALEGGISYWTEGTWSYHWLNHWLNDDQEDYAGFRAVIQYDHEREGTRLDPSVRTPEPCRVQIDRSVIARGWNLARRAPWRNGISWSSEKPPIVWTVDSDWDYDAYDADVIVQLGLFGDVIYG